MRICPKCRLITDDRPVCAECGWNLQGGQAVKDVGAYSARHLRAMVWFIAVMFVAALVVSFTVMHTGRWGPAMAGGLFGAGLIADLLLLRIIYRAAGCYNEVQHWMVGAVLTFPFGTLVFAWLLARRLEVDKKSATGDTL
jgi:hypothetical protein